MNKKCIREPIGRGVAPNYRLALLPAMLMAVVGTAWAVDGGVVAAGAGAIKTQGKTTTISQSSDKMIVNWKNFNIGKDQSVIVNQPGATSAVLNRVTTANPTQIDGTLKANGRVFVVNPAGVVFGKSAKVDVGSLVASTLDANDQQFMNMDGKPDRYLNLSAGGRQGQVTNNGQLTAQESVILLGPQAANYGTIRAKNVTLGAADGAAMVLRDSGISVSLGREAQNALAANYGVIAADGGDVKLSAAAAGAMLGTVVHNAGVIEATRASPASGGSIVLGTERDGKVTVGGRLTADGKVRVTGQMPSTYVPFDPSTAPTSGRAPAGHDITVNSGAKIEAANGTVEIDTVGGNVSVNGRVASSIADISAYGGALAINSAINAGQVGITGGTVSINAPVNGGSLVHISGTERLEQNANVNASTGSVFLESWHGDIAQSDGVKTSAATSLTLFSGSLAPDRPATGNLRVANLNAKTISISGGDVTLAGNLKADGDISVQSKLYNPPCPSDATCAAVMAGGRLRQVGNVTSQDGNVTLKAHSSISQQVSSRTMAGDSVMLSASSVETGTIRADNRIAIDARVSRLGGRLTAQEVDLPANTQNTDHNIRILPKSANL
ncbi:filamentous hemagglutinin family protein [Paraburkholderia sp. GV068]|jgi:filamentous hemagglutinin family protein|uniref:two-partner secretion domain-containing protein n=1 Tax=unclassified Paraburkholderia TaxID=2615204 RepID=UPI000D31BBF7|nr:MULTISPECIES: filamentous hemagglutinin N-terminal domain-containing protein [unclassified Paraburkholderia]PTQ92536.1 filamentous hemagglutinin family protein [Paraburkholderia sp. GV072]PUA94765.1 filamentous hemagglutinin family protein [Paraburkholderia sp. GV068]